MNDYQSERNRKYTTQVRCALNDLPPFCAEFFRGIENTSSVLTRYAYSVDLKLFFAYLSTLDEFPSELREMDFDTLRFIRAEHIEMFLEHVNYYSSELRERENHERAKARKLSSIRSLFKYFFKKEILPSNVAALVDTPKLHEKPIIRLDVNEVADLLDSVDSGAKLSPRQMAFHKHSKIRDCAILTLFLGTGIRISELVGLNIHDFDFETNAFTVTRKGGNRVVLYYSDEIKLALLAYMELRAQQPASGGDDAFFLSNRNCRINQRSVQNLVKKYTSAAVPLKNISPHKLRSTYGTMLYQETGDIYLVADVLGHKDVNTTRKHYAAIEEGRRKMAANMVKLRDPPSPSE